MNVINRFAVDLVSRGVQPWVHAMQNDGGTRTLVLSLMENGDAWAIPAGVSGSIAYKKPDGTTGQYDQLPDGQAGVVLSGSIATVLLAPQMLAIPGKVEAALVLQDENLHQLSAFPFLVLVTANPAGSKGISNDYYRYQTLEQVNQAIEQLRTTVEQFQTDYIPRWEYIRNAVREGHGPSLFPVGRELIAHNSVVGDVVWVVRGHDHHEVPGMSHTMTLEMKRLYGGTACKPLAYDGQEAMYTTPSGMAAGVYHFTVKNQAWYGADEGKTYQFTLTKAVPAGGQLVLNTNGGSALQGKTISVYAGATAAAELEKATLSQGSGGTNLGATDGTGNMNILHRAVCGSNNYAQSALRQWLNSSAAAGFVWKPQTKFDRPPQWHLSGDAAYAGFMRGFDSEFLASVRKVKIPCHTNGTFECPSLDGTQFTPGTAYTLTDYFFVLSRPEIYGSWNNVNCKDGTQLAYYQGLTSAQCTKLDAAGVAWQSALRSPMLGMANTVRVVHANGAFTEQNAANSMGVCAACVIS